MTNKKNMRAVTRLWENRFNRGNGIKMEEKDSIERILKSINLEEAREVIKKSDESHNYFMENYDKIVEEHAGCIVAVVTGKIVSVPFTDDVSKAKQNFETLEREIGKENMSGARISYIPKPKEFL